MSRAEFGWEFLGQGSVKSPSLLVAVVIVEFRDAEYSWGLFVCGAEGVCVRC